MEGKPEDMREAVRAFLFEHAEEQYRDFSKSLTPGDINMLGVRLPVLSNAKRVCKCLSSIGISITTSANHNVLS